MKFLFVFLFLLSLQVSAAHDPDVRYYYLKCPNGKIVTSVELEFEKQSVHIDFGADDRTDFKPWSLQYDHVIRIYELGSAALERKVSWKDGIRFVPENLGLPSEIDGCEVIPIVVYFEDIGYVGSRNDYLALDEYNRLIFNVHFYNPSTAKIVFSDQYKRLTPQEKYELIEFRLNPEGSRINIGSSYDLKIPLSRTSGSMVDLEYCTWWDDNTPKNCHSVSWAPGMSDNFYINDVEFWRNGIFKSGKTPARADFWPKDWNDPSGQKMQCEEGPIGYRFNGELEFCVDMKEAP